MTAQHGPGPVIHGQDVTNPERFIVQYNGGPPQLLTPAEIAQLPIRHQWFTGTANGLIASWWSREVAERSAMERGTLLGQIVPHFGADYSFSIPVLCDVDGNPLRAE